jgi:DNA-binding IclR family transcriptional regulator
MSNVKAGVREAKMFAAVATPTRAYILLMLCAGLGMSLKEICKQTKLHRSNASREMRRLIRATLATKNDRGQFVLTNNGIRLQMMCTKLFHEVI